jgi:hypothetical protein
MRVPVPMGVSMRLLVSMDVSGRVGLGGMLMIMRMIMVATVMLFMFHRVRIPSMLECLHAPQRREKNTRP